MNGVDVFAHVCGQKADTSSNYYDKIQPYDRRRFSLLSNVTRFLELFLFLDCFTTNSNFYISQGSAAT